VLHVLFLLLHKNEFCNDRREGGEQSESGLINKAKLCVDESIGGPNSRDDEKMVTAQRPNTPQKNQCQIDRAIEEKGYHEGVNEVVIVAFAVVIRGSNTLFTHGNSTLIQSPSVAAF